MIDTTLPGFDVEAVWDGACRILEQVGLEVATGKALARPARELPVRGGRVCFPREMIEHYAGEIRQKAARCAPAPRSSVTMCNSAVCHHYLHPITGETRPYDTETLIRHTRLACRLGDEGLLLGRATGYPLDVPPRMQFLTSYFVECCHSRSPASHCLITDEVAMKYMMEIAAVMGHAQMIGVEPISPLKFAGASVDIAVAHGRADLIIGVDAMPIMGITAPLDWHAAWAQSVAECLGTYALLRLCGCERIEPPSFRLFMPNMATAKIYLSSPRHIFALLTRRKVREFFALATDSSELMLVSGAAPDHQAAVEKAAGCLLSKLFGFYVVEGAGNLRIDEVFSPQQLLIDLEICNFVNSIGAEFGRAGQDLVETVREGVARGNFLDTSLTLDHFGEFFWRPVLFDLSAQATRNAKGLLAKAAEWAERKTAEHDYQLEGDKRRQLERIMAEARQALAA